MRAAIVHYWLLNMRGGEKVLEALCRLLPEADIYTLFYNPESVSPTIRSHRITSSFVQPLWRHHRSLLPLMPMALENFDLRGYDLIVSSESGPAKGVIVPSGARHVCYCHTPMRYLWDLYPAYRNEWTQSRVKRALMTPLTHYLRMWDYATAARVDEFIANSENVRRRIAKTYRREASVIFPPVAIEKFYSKPSEDYDLIVSELVAYKRIDVAVRVFSQSGRRLKIAGDGPEFAVLKRIATPNIEFCGRVSDDDLRELYARCRAFLMPGEEDFGITAVEALASGKPVIALARGGALETVPAYGGVLYGDATDDGLRDAIAQLDSRECDVGALQAWAARFSEAAFAEKIQPILRTG
jgi:glycosyltransferase involved in cell wall biosynthesis